MKDRIQSLIEASIETKRRSLSLTDAIAESGQALIDAFANGRRVLTCGNGGSAADAQHMAAELVGRFETERAALPCIALTTDTSMLTAWANDYGYETVFARQVAAIGQPGDVLVGITTSGKSPSILRAMEEAGRRDMLRIALTGRDGGDLAHLAGVRAIVVPSDRTARIQEVHLTIIHIWAALIDDAWRDAGGAVTRRRDA
jgi:DnaA initiator-associating protein